MVDKTRKSGAAGGRGRKASARKPGTFAGKPGKGPAKPRQIGGVDERTLAYLKEQGMLNPEGRRALEEEGEKASPKEARAAKPDRAVAVRGRAPARKEARAGLGARRFSPAEKEVAERLQKVMARAGVASRRHSEELIQAGRVTVNGQVVTELGTKVIPGRDLVELDGRPLGRDEEKVYLLLNKPKGYVTTLFDPQGRPKVVDLLGGEIAERVYPVGRLDFETEGLLLLTNDGELANALMHPTRQVKKTYIAKVRGVPGPAKVRQLESGVELEDGMTAPAEVKIIDVKAPNSSTVSIRIHEGRNRQVRRMLEAVGHEVIHLKRTTLGPLHLKDLEPGQWRELGDRELTELRAAAGFKASRAEIVAEITAKKKAIRRGVPAAEVDGVAERTPRVRGGVVAPGRRGRGGEGAARPVVRGGITPGAPRSEGRGGFDRTGAPRSEGRGGFDRTGAPRSEGRDRFDRGGAPRGEGRGGFDRTGAPRSEGRGGFDRGGAPRSQSRGGGGGRGRR